MAWADSSSVSETSTKEPQSTLHRIKSLKGRAKVATKKALKIDPQGPVDAEQNPYDAALGEINESPAFNSAKFLEATHIGASSKADQAISLVQSTIDAIIHPRKAITAKATRTTAGSLAKSRPQLSRQCDLDFLQAHDELSRAVSSRGARDDEEAVARKNSNIEDRQRQVRDLERKRESMRAAWVTGRHVKRVRSVNKEPEPLPGADHFEKKDDCGADEFQWHIWLGRVLLYHSHRFSAQYIDDFEELPFDIDTLRKNLERLIMVSASAQTFLSKVRRIYRWDNPVTTIKWMTLYFFLLHISHIMTFAYGYGIYVVVRNYYYPTRLGALREGIERSLDRGATAFKIGELMDRNGNDDWLAPLLEELGPFIQIQVIDLANLLEVMYNFYHYASPRATFNALILLTTVFALTLLTSSEYSMKVFWFIIGMTFFIFWPVSSLYPQYRLLVSPIKWFFWDVPTHAEWSFGYLQSRAEVAKRALEAAEDEEGVEDDSKVRIVAENPEDTASLNSFETATPETKNDHEPTARNIFSITCTHNHVPGSLHLSTIELKFTPSFTSPLAKVPSRNIPKDNGLAIPYTSLVEMTKQSSRLSAVAGIKKLEIRYYEEGQNARGKERVVRLGGLGRKERDKIFNAIIGFSKHRWQSLQKRVTPDVL
ncbi:hypothetical protein BP6252_02799 [Coleophoma cylindrospora]|uniref:Uncharacterized protein n=1 Tax=Coleophoma cylindrospora TaxID=1849047 RepID=A0A3D8SFU3_9HELO|nr:hypothetical protein BP6252_02799 [Coleophoma cylindrospora]